MISFLPQCFRTKQKQTPQSEDPLRRINVKMIERWLHMLELPDRVTINDTGPYLRLYVEELQVARISSGEIQLARDIATNLEVYARVVALLQRLSDESEALQREKEQADIATVLSALPPLDENTENDQ